MAEPGDVEDESSFELQSFARGKGLAEREDVHGATVAMLHAILQPCAREAVVGKVVLQRIEVCEALDTTAREAKGCAPYVQRLNACTTVTVPLGVILNTVPP